MLFYISFLLIFVACDSDSVPIEATSGQALVSYARGFKVFEFDTNYVIVIGENRYSFSKNLKNSTYVLSGVTQLQFLKALNEDTSIIGLFDANYFNDSTLFFKIVATEAAEKSITLMAFFLTSAQGCARAAAMVASSSAFNPFRVQRA